jgi:hypothetical protein
MLTLPTSAAAAADPYDHVVEALRQQPAPGIVASTILPTPASRLEEEEQVLELARRYTRSLVHAS